MLLKVLFQLRAYISSCFWNYVASCIPKLQGQNLLVADVDRTGMWQGGDAVQVPYFASKTNTFYM
jgi:hypothetical protein